MEGEPSFKGTVSTEECSKMICFMVESSIKPKMEKVIKGNGDKIRNMGSEYISGPMEANTKDIMKKERGMGRD